MKRVIAWWQLWQKEILALLVVMVVVLGYEKPLWSQPTTQVVNNEDGVFIAWTLRTVQDKLLTGDWQHFWDGGIFWPHQQTLAFSDIYLTPAWLTLPLRLVTDEPIAILTLATVLFSSLTMVGMYFLVHELSRDRLISVTVTIVFFLSPFYRLTLGYLQNLSLWGVPLALVGLIQFKQSKRRGWLWLWLGAYIAEVTTSFLPALFVLFGSLIYWMFSPKLRQRLGQNTRLVTGIGMTAAVVTGLMALPYSQVSQRYAYVRPITDVMHFSLSFDQLGTDYWSPAMFLLGLIGVGAGLRHTKRRKEGLWLGVGATGALLMALGPALKWHGESVKIPFHIPLPYAILYYIVPGFKGIRAVARWVILVGMLVSTWGATALSRLVTWQRGLALGGLIMLAGLTYRPLRTLTVPDEAVYPAVYDWLATQPMGAVLELPIAKWGQGDKTREEIWRMLYQTYHKHPLVNGYSGFSPPEWEQLVDRPGQLIREYQPVYVLVHTNQVGSKPEMAGYRLVTQINQTQVYAKEN